MRGLRFIQLIAVSAALLAGCGGSKPAPPTAMPPSPASARPVAAPVPPEEFVASGPIVVENQVDVSAQREGVVASVLADVDTHVRRGQVLARLDDRQLTADRDAAEARVKSIEADLKHWEAIQKVHESDLERTEGMWQAQLITKQDLEHARYKVIGSQFEVARERQNYQNAIATRRSLELELGKTKVLAPFDGVVARRYVRVGQKVALGERLFWVTAVSPMLVKFTLPEKFLGQVKRGDQVTVTTLSFPDQSHAARIVGVSPVVDPSSGTIEITAQLTGATGELRPGMTANVRLGSRP